MRILRWNCWGICNASIARALQALIRVHNPVCVFLCKTKASEDRMKKLASSIGFSEHVLVSAKGKAGGICLLWSNSLDAEILEFDSQTVAVKVSDDFCSWVMIGFYGLLYQTKRYKAWGNLYALLQSISEPWLCFGDFNVVVDDAEKDGGIRGSSSTPNFLKDLLFDLGAIDLGFAGCKFT